jgi:hypothetical protein
MMMQAKADALTSEQLGQTEGLRWADEQVTVWGLEWLAGIELGSGAMWDAFKRCYALGDFPSDEEVYTVMFGDPPFDDEFIAAFVGAALERFRELKVATRGTTLRGDTQSP